MNLSGSLDAFGLPDVFALLAGTGKTGGLRLHRTQADRRVEGVVWFQEGRITAASANCQRQGLVRRLVGSGAVDDTALRAAVARAVGSPVGVARALLEAGAAEPDLVREAAADQVVDAVFDLMRWPDGDFGFEAEARSNDDVGVALEHDWVVGEVAARMQVWEQLREVIPADTKVVSLPVVVEQDPQLTREEWAVLSLVDGHRTIAEIVDLTGSGEYAVTTILAGLARRGLLTVGDSSGHVGAVQRRLALLADVESGPATPALVAPPVSHPASAPTPEPEPASESAPRPVSSTSGPMTASEALAAVRAAQGRGAMTPPARPAAHHEAPPKEAPRTSLAAAARLADGDMSNPVTVGNTAVAPSEIPAIDSLIERDPAVNRSLLLRLIAGVRGL